MSREEGDKSFDTTVPFPARASARARHPALVFLRGELLPRPSLWSATR